MQDTIPTPTTTPEQFAWNDAFLLGFAEMDETHREFVAVVQQLLATDAASAPRHMQAFIDHAHAHFGAEDQWMRETDFPAGDCHIDEHAQVMQSALEVMERAHAGDVATVHRFARELVRWFPGHADYLDSALAAWMVKRRHGARPLVFRRKTV